MEEFRGWIVNICTAVFFITAVEMILPDNKMKKYARFVLGLILITVIINPLVKFINRGMDISTFINRSSNYINENNLEFDSNKYQDKSMENTLSVFKTNLEKLCEEKLKEKYVKGSYEVKAEVAYDKENDEFKIKELTIGVASSGIRKVQKIEINANSSYSTNNRVPSEMSGEIKDYLSSELKLSKDIISVYKLGN